MQVKAIAEIFDAFPFLKQARHKSGESALEFVYNALCFYSMMWRHYRDGYCTLEAVKEMTRMKRCRKIKFPLDEERVPHAFRRWV